MLIARHLPSSSSVSWRVRNLGAAGAGSSSEDDATRSSPPRGLRLPCRGLLFGAVLPFRPALDLEEPLSFLEARPAFHGPARSGAVLPLEDLILALALSAGRAARLAAMAVSWSSVNLTVITSGVTPAASRPDMPMIAGLPSAKTLMWNVRLLPETASWYGVPPSSRPVTACLNVAMIE